MKRVITEKDIEKANNVERCEILLEIIKGQAIYKKTR